MEAAGQPAWSGRVAVIGGGTMGLGFAEQFALAGVRVRFVDATPDLTSRAMANLTARVAGHVAAGIVPPDATARLALVETAADIADAVADAAFVLEAVPETLDLKRTVLGACAAGAPDAVIASNTSSFPIGELARFVAAPARFVGMHWFNPPEWTPGVEVIPHAGTDPAVTAWVLEFLRSIGKRPVVVGSGPAFVANRIQCALFREAAACVEAGLATPAEVDEVVRSTFGFRLPFFGPFQIVDMAGLDVHASVFRTLARDLGDEWSVPPILAREVAAGRLGTKTGAGFYDYTAEERDQLLIERDRRYAALTEVLATLPPVVYGTPHDTYEEETT